MVSKGRKLPFDNSAPYYQSYDSDKGYQINNSQAYLPESKRFKIELFV